MGNILGIKISLKCIVFDKNREADIERQDGWRQESIRRCWNLPGLGTLRRRS
jgi:hypothetical protein